ncbi:LTA synthase family protein [Paenibacillus sp. DMB5]|uniref:LTA synthase family protein n=1 Tax=Paenibacillus sp. DMB5 TaxID=1780103 RepID=UPI000AE28F6C|nr:LTA synthase family protein [Paenibacillus sp. DMB5]
MRHTMLPRRTWQLAAGLLLAGFLLNFCLQAASFSLELQRIFGWILEYPLLYISGSLFFFFFLLAASVLLPNMYIGPGIILLAGAVTGTANYKKLSTTGEPLFPWDLLLLKNAADMRTITKGMISPPLLAAGVLFVAVLVLLLRRLPEMKLRLPSRITLGVISVIILAGFITMVSGQSPLASSLKYQNIFWNQKVNYTQNGFLYAFTGNLRQNLMEQPEGYSKQAIEEIAARYREQPDSGGTAAAGEQPNILFMMDEAFFDPTRLEGLAFSEDPLSFIHSAEQTTPSGYLLSPEFGGNTANVEFEALTGLSMYFLNDGSIPYQQRLVKMSFLPSIVSILKERGYKAEALHPFDETFYNRNRVYPMLGFDSFTSEKDMGDSGRITPDGYISDKFAVQEAVRRFRSAADPVFLHLVTMQNHFPFTKGLNGPNTISVSGVEAEYKDEIETYVHNTSLTDEALAYLQQELLTIERPTIAVFWGDHLPALSSGIYSAAGWDREPRLKHETKLMVLANFDIGADPLGTLSPAYLGPEVFRLSGMSLPPYYKLLEQVQAEIPGLSKAVLLGNSGPQSGLTPKQQELLDDYRLVEYDLLEGESYSAGLLF